MRIRFQKMNMEEECYYDLLDGKGFLIKDKPFSDADKTIRNMDGARSPRYGTTWGDSGEFLDRFRCKCGRYIGASFEGEICPDCKEPIEDQDIDMMQTGWLNFTPYKIINPYFYYKLQSALSKKILENIISNDNIITSNGLIRHYKEDIEVKKSLLKYHNIGMKAFYENFEEIMLYYKQKRKMKADLIDYLIENKRMVWTSKIPVYSTVLRSQGITAESYYFSPIDKLVYPLSNITINLKTAMDIQVPLYLISAQQKINELWNINFSLIDGKSGWIRGNVLGGRFNYSGRNVIVLDPTLKMDQVDVAYKSFLVQYNNNIVREIMLDKGWSLIKSYNFLKSKFEYDDYVYSIMCRLVDRGVKFIIQRNPTLTYGSILLMTIRKVKPDSNDLSLSIPSAILPSLNADFDGDAINTEALPLEELYYMFQGFEPTYMIIDRSTGYIKTDCSAMENISLSLFSDH